MTLHQEHLMRIGALTSKFSADKWTLEQIIDWAGDAGIECLEIERRHLDFAAMLESGPREALLARLKAKRVGISALSFYGGALDLTSGDATARSTALRTLELAIDAAAALGVGVVCTIPGAPAPGKSKLDTIRQDLPGIFGPAIERAAAKGIKIALENWFRTNIQHLDHWQALFEVLPQANFGLNFDPSHLDRFEIDYLAAVKEFAPRIFHTHAKDVIVDHAARRRLGVMDGADSRYCIPGTGRIHWGQYISRLREVGYDGVLSIEHEDRCYSSVDGFLVAAAHLRQSGAISAQPLAAKQAAAR
jgi:sugar phosphate isomerase/epimerase